MEKSKDSELLELDALVTELANRRHYNKIEFAFPDEGPLNRSLYPTQVKFFKAGKQFKERAIIAGNRSGKSFAAMYEVVLHATGEYPHWWEGHRFKHPVTIWCAGNTIRTTRDILQVELLGRSMDMGSGLIPKDKIHSVVNMPSVTQTVQTIRVKHSTNGIEDGISEITFKSYDQGREVMQGDAINFIAIDEEPRDYGIYEECLTRTLKCRFCSDLKCEGRITATFTPLYGVSKTVMQFMPGGQFPEDNINHENGKWVCPMSLWDVPHMSQESKEAYAASLDPWMRDVRMKGLPQLGSGQIYPVLEADISVEPFEIPNHWPRCFALDVGWEKTAVVWFAQNPDDNVWYIYSEHYVGRQEVPLHVEAIRSRGKWIPGVVDPASNRTRDDGTRLFNQYVELGLNLRLANNTIEAGLSLVWQMLSCGQLKVFNTCKNWFMEFRMYHKDDNGKIPDRQPDHLMDAMRYGVMSGLQIAMTNPAFDDDDDDNITWFAQRPDMGASEITGY